MQVGTSSVRDQQSLIQDVPQTRKFGDTLLGPSHTVKLMKCRVALMVVGSVDNFVIEGVVEIEGFVAFFDDFEGCVSRRFFIELWRAVRMSAVVVRLAMLVTTAWISFERMSWRLCFRDSVR
jgi:hypothetical protein